MKSLILISTLAVVYCSSENVEPVENKSTVEDLEKPVKVTTLPFYGGAKGQALQIIERTDGKVSTQIIQSPSASSTEPPAEEVTNLSELEYPQLPTKYESEYGYNVKNIHRTALNIIKLQEAAKKHGQLSDVEEADYRKNMDSLNSSAKSLAQLQEDADDDSLLDDEGLAAWFDRKKKKDEQKKKEEEKRKEEEKKKKEEEETKKKEGDQKKKDEDKKKQEEHKKQEEMEKEKEKEKEEEEEEEVEDDNDTVVVNLPPDDASVAEAKPVGLAIAGVGGVAASKPIATAVVGPGGLAVARPVGTAIAGVAPDQALVPIYAEAFVKPSRKRDPSKEGNKKYSQSSELLNRIISKYHQV